jgi:uncharacterized RDD family membrane protein YckC
MDQQVQGGHGAPRGYGPPPGTGQPPYGNAAGDPWTRPASQGSPGYGQQPAYPPAGGYGPPPGYGSGPAAHPPGQQPYYGNGYQPPGYQAGQQPAGFAPPAQQPIPPGAPGPLPEWWERLLARIIDNVLFFVVSLILSSVIGAVFAAGALSGGLRFGFGFYFAMTMAYLISAALCAGYDVVMHSRNGQTLGKMALKIRLVTPEGGRPDQASLIKRAAVYPAAGFALTGVLMLVPGFLLSGLPTLVSIAYAVVILVPILTDPLRRGPHDRWANTIVVKA